MFDGDEGNLYSSQSLQTCREVAGLMSVSANIMTGQTNNNAAPVVFDALAGSYMMSLNETRVSSDTFMAARMIMEDTSSFLTLQERLEKYNVDKDSGRALISTAFPVDFYYRKEDTVIREGILTSGTLNSGNLGSAHNSIVQAIYKDYGQERTVVFLTDIYRIAGVFMNDHSLSVSMADCYLSDEKGNIAIRAEIEKAKMLTKAMGGKLTDPMEEERREKQIRGFLDTAKNFGSKISKELLDKNNSFNIMALSGAKGSVVNISQITGLLGQQFIGGGERPAETMSGGTRVLPYFKPGDLDPAARGFIENSYLTGLTPAEMFFALAGARPAVVESSTKISTVGTIHRNLTKAMENITIADDGSVRNGTGVIYQFSYEDGFDPSMVELTKTKSGTFTSFINLERIAGKINSKYGF